ncbi:carbohydrate-binding family 9-like protein [Aestuariivivens sediminicola]|uniref:carbohydrate-binding family 9-like protein n=1 Tax=Aestuariivivens sediminicola TaxID=2913560 RepID=UPI001F567CE9|nr:carbohydrate-binding family 9-like protein [Aestuariivivens sediminicola]
MKVYNVNRITEHAIITGSGDASFWAKAHVLTDFKSPWDLKKIKPITFRALHSSEHLLFCFRVEDTEVYIDRTDNTKSSIGNSDRVELFFRADEQLDPYYCLEIDPSPRIMDFIARPSRNFDFSWYWPQDGIRVKSARDATGFTVEGAISLATLKALNVLNGNRIETGIYRAKYHRQSNGSYTPTWITWIDPRTEMPEFHTPSSFGVLQLLD